MTAPQRTVVVAATCAVGLGLVMFDNTATTLALPAIGRYFDADTSALQWVAAAMFLAAATCLPLSGAVGDRFGARRTMRIGLAVFGLSAIVAASAPSIEVLVGARIGEGLGVALCLPNGAALLGANVPAGPARNRAVGIWITVSSAGLVLGPLGGGWLVGTVGWRAIFAIHLPVALLGAVGTARLRESNRNGGGSLDLPGVVTAGVGLALLCFSFVELGRADRRLPLVGCALVLSGLMLALFVRFTRRAAAPVLDLSLFRSRSYRALMLASLVYNGTIAGGAFLLSLLFQQARGLSVAATGLILLVATIGMPFGGQTMGRLASTGLAGRAMGLAVGVLALAYVVIAILALGPVAWIVLPLLLTGYTAGFLYSGDTLAVLGAVASDKAASGLAALSLVRQVGAAIGIAVLGSLSSMLQQANLVDVGVRAGLMAAGLAVAPCVILLRHVHTA